MAKLKAGTTIGGYQVITKRNVLDIIKTIDGTGSGLDADTVDGFHASHFAVSTHNHDSSYLKLTGGTLSNVLNISKAGDNVLKVESTDGNDVSLLLHRSLSTNASWKIINDNGTFKIQTDYSSSTKGAFYDCMRVDYTSGNLTAKGTIYANNNKQVFHEGHLPLWTEIEGKPSTFTPSSHTHDDRYYTESESLSNFFRANAANTVDVRLSSTDGRGLRFWDSDSYKIYMSSEGNATWGGRMIGDTVSDYNIYFKILGGNRGFNFRTDAGIIANIGKDGDLRTKGSVSMGNNKVELKYNTDKDALEFIFK